MLDQFGTANTIILLVYLGGMVSIGMLLAGRQKTTNDYFLAGRNMPWLAVGMSMFASLTSATTYMGVPAFAFNSNVAMIFGVVMSLVAAPILARLFYPVYRRHRVTTSYEYILSRFGPSARKAVSALFVLGRLSWLGIVIYAPAKAMSVASGMPLNLAIVLVGLLAVTYTVLGGLSAVIWTDVVQFIILFGGAAWLVVTLVTHVPGGAGGIVRVAANGGKFAVFDWTDLGKLTAFSAAIGWFLFFLHDYGTDQVTVQRLLAVRTDAGAVKAIAFNAVNDLLINGMLIFIGIGMFAYFRAYPDRLDGDVGTNGMLPFYIMHILPAGASGLMVTAIFAAAMSSVDSGINSLSTVIVNDWIAPWRRKNCQDAGGGDITLARELTVALGVLATLGAFQVARMDDTVVKTWMKIMGLFAAPILSIFVLGLLTRRAHFLGWLVGACIAIPSTVVLWLVFKDRLMDTWHFLVSFVVTTGVGYTVSALTPGLQRSRP